MKFSLSKPLLGILLCSAFVCHARGQESSSAQRRAEHLRRGVSVSDWFTDDARRTVPELRAYTTPSDLEHIKALGFDHVRIPVGVSTFECLESGQDCERLQLLDEVVSKSVGMGLAVILDFHPVIGFTRQLQSDDEAVNGYVRLWTLIAKHFEKTDPNFLFFELMNEFGIHDRDRWSGIQARAAQSVRQVVPRHTLIVTGAAYSDAWDLAVLPLLQDDNVIYSFHFYEPHLFTHQGTSWGLVGWRDLHDLPFPADPAAISAIIAKENDPEMKWQLTQYAQDSWNPEHISSYIKFAADWGRLHKVSVICDEFGVFKSAVEPSSRMRWLSAVRIALEQNNLGWTVWDYQGGFGVVAKHGNVIIDDSIALRGLGLPR